jgi:hypothetical protein
MKLTIFVVVLWSGTLRISVNFKYMNYLLRYQKENIWHIYCTILLRQSLASTVEAVRS